MKILKIRKSEWGNTPLPEKGETFADPRYPGNWGLVVDRQDRYDFEANLLEEDVLIDFVLTTQS